jgi:serralysin
MATAVNQGATGDAFIDGLLIGTKWSGSFTFSFPQLATDYQAGNEETATFSPVSFQQREATRAIMTGQTFGATTNVMKATNVNSFIGVSVSEAGGLGNGLNGAGDIRLGTSPNANPTAYGYYPSNAANGEGGDVWFGTSFNYSNPILGNYSYHTHIHELGHAMGLKHSHETGGVSNVAVPSSRDAIEFTVMSYRSFVGGPTSGYTYGTWDAPQTFMMYDILALQTMYGAYYGASSNNTNTTYTWSDTTGQMFINGVGQGTPGGNKVFLTIWDGGGIDTYDMSNYAGGVTINLDPGGWSITSDAQRAQLGSGNQANGTVYNSLLFGGNLASIIENAVGGAGADNISGNQVANTLSGNAGNDTLSGADGNDTLNGGDGSDSLKGGGANDTLNGDNSDDNLKGGGGADALNGGAGTDTADYAFSSAIIVSLETNFGSGGDAAGDTFSSIENVSGTAGDDNITGNGFNNVLSGGDGNDVLKGGGGLDTLNGGIGNDQLLGGFSTDNVNGGDGDDTVIVLDGEFIDNVDGGVGTDTLDLDNISGDGPVTINLTAGTWDETPSFGGPATIANIERVIGTQFGDSIIGDNLGVASNSITFLDGQGGNDTLVGDSGSDTILGGLGDDSLRGGFDTDSVNGGDGNDTITVLEGEFVDNVDGGSGSDTLDLSDIDGLGQFGFFSGPAVIDLVAGSWNLSPSFGGPVTIASIERIIGTQLGDSITSANFGDRLNFVDGQAGNDTIVGDDFSDTILGGTGNDSILGGFNNDSINAGVGKDTIVVLEGEFIDDVDGGGGNDLLDLSNMTGLGGPGGVSGGAVINLAAGTWDLTTGSGGARTIAGIEIIQATQLADNIIGGAGADTIYGNGGNDTLDGGGGSDKLRGGLGDDVYIVTAANEAIELVGEGTDTVQSAITYILGANLENLTLTGGGNVNGTGNGLANVMTGNSGNNFLIANGGGIDTLQGGLGDDIYRVDISDVINELFGEGTDTVRTIQSHSLGANLENLILEGAANVNGTGNGLNNQLNGNSGNNTLTGGLGRDVLVGGLGVDRFDFNAITESGTAAGTRDIITDFDAATNVTSVDRIDLSTIDANDLLGGNQVFLFDGTFGTGHVIATQLGGNTLIQLNTDADAAADMIIQLTGVLATNINGGDFFL